MLIQDLNHAVRMQGELHLLGRHIRRVASDNYLERSTTTIVSG